MKRRSRRNPVRPEFDCRAFNKALEFCFPEEKHQKWWAEQLLITVAKSQKRLPEQAFRSSLEMVRSGKGVKCGPLIKAIEKITRLGNGEEWLRYGLQGYLDQEWKKDRGDDMVFLCMSRDPKWTCNFLHETLKSVFGPIVSRHLPPEEAKTFFEMLLDDYPLHYYNRIADHFSLKDKHGRFRISDPNTIAYWAMIALDWNQTIKRTCEGNTRGRRVAYGFYRIDYTMKEFFGRTLADALRAVVPRYVI